MRNRERERANVTRKSAHSVLSRAKHIYSSSSVNQLELDRSVHPKHVLPVVPETLQVHPILKV